MDLFSLDIEQIAFAVLLENGPEYPPVTIEVRELGVLQLRVQVADLLEKFRVAPVASQRRPSGLRSRIC